MNTGVEIYNDEPRAGTFLISQGFEREHKYILELVRKYENDFKDFGCLKRRKLKSTGGRAANEILLNEDQAMFLGTLLRNNSKSVPFKKGLIKAFKRCRQQLAAVQDYHENPAYLVTRDAGKIVRKQTTDVMQKFVEYAESQGSKNASRYYGNITRMLNSLLFIVDGKYKNLRNVMSTQQLMTTSSAEQIIDRGLIDGMARKKYYKDIYKDIKSKVRLFAELHGQSEIVVKQLAKY
jgi:phage regulator Rha-like protein